MTVILSKIANGWTITITGLDDPECQAAQWVATLDEAMDYVKKHCGDMADA